MRTDLHERSKMNKELNKISVNKYNHIFYVQVLKSGKVQCSIDNGEAFPVEKLNNNKIFFSDKHEVIFENKPFTLDELELEEKDFNALEQAVKKEKEYAAQKKEREEDMRFVTSWKKKLVSSNKQEEKYCVHEICIGDSRYQFVERMIPGKGIVINPDYKVSDTVPFVGGIPKKHGELIYWDYLFEDKGWQKVRELSYNEYICLNLIKKYGCFSGNEIKEPKKKWFLWKK